MQLHGTMSKMFHPFFLSLNVASLVISLVSSKFKVNKKRAGGERCEGTKVGPILFLLGFQRLKEI